MSMDITAIIKTSGKIYDMGKKIYETIKENESHRFILLEQITYPEMRCADYFPPFSYEDKYLKIDKVDDSHIKVTVLPFDDKDAWNGPSIVGPKDEKLLFASLLHDILYYRMAQISEQTLIDEAVIRKFADVAFANLCKAYGVSDMKTTAFYTVLRGLGGVYHKYIAKWFTIVALLLAVGCSYPIIMELDNVPIPSYQEVVGQDVAAVPTEPTEPTESIVEEYQHELPSVEETLPNDESDESNEVSYNSYDLDWRWGGFNGSKAECVGDCISSLKISSNLSYKTTRSWWSSLGCSSKEDAGAIACLFIEVDGKFVGGKFDWISESRTARDFKNLKERYHGWDYDAFCKSHKFLFCVVSKDGKRRTNIIEYRK